MILGNVGITGIVAVCYRQFLAQNIRQIMRKQEVESWFAWNKLVLRFMRAAGICSDMIIFNTNSIRNAKAMSTLSPFM